MNIDPRTTHGKIAIMQAYLDHKRIRYRKWRSEAPWVEVTLPSWNWNDHEYGVIPEEREFWIYGGNAFKTKSGALSYAAERIAAGGFQETIIHVKEVEEENAD